MPIVETARAEVCCAREAESLGLRVKRSPRLLSKRIYQANLSWVYAVGALLRAVAS